MTDWESIKHYVLRYIELNQYTHGKLGMETIKEEVYKKFGAVHGRTENFIINLAVEGYIDTKVYYVTDYENSIPRIGHIRGLTEKGRSFLID